MNSHGKIFLFSFLAGVLQGCPLSATLFLFAIDPFLVHFEIALKGKYNGEVRACADDVGLCLGDFRTLKVVFKVFKCAQDFANLILKPVKCNIVPLNQIDPLFEDGEKERDYIANWLRNELPQWGKFNVSLSAKYLGFYMGPKAADKAWAAPISKWAKRRREIAHSKMNHTLATISYNSRAIPVLGYIGQLLPPPVTKHAERSLLHHLFHLPTNSWDGNSFYQLYCIGLKDIVSVEAHCRAALIRTANCTIKGWRSFYGRVKLTADQHLSIREIACGRLSTSWWDTPPYVHFLRQAFYGNEGYTDTRTASRKAHAASRDPENKKSIQSIAFASIKEMRDDPESRFLLLSRRTAPLGFSNQFVLSRSDVQSACDIAKTARPADAMAWFKTVTNAWCTSSRMHEPTILKCIFGCRDECDKLSHYLECHVLWSILAEVFPGDIANSPYSRVNYVKPSLRKLCLISCVFEIYHAMKIGLRHEVDGAQSNRLFGGIYRTAHRLAKDFLHSHFRVFTLGNVCGSAPYPTMSNSSISNRIHHRNTNTPYSSNCGHWECVDSVPEGRGRVPRNSATCPPADHSTTDLSNSDGVADSTDAQGLQPAFDLICNTRPHMLQIAVLEPSTICSDSDFDFFGPFERGETSSSSPDEAA